MLTHEKRNLTQEQKWAEERYYWLWFWNDGCGIQNNCLFIWQVEEV